MKVLIMGGGDLAARLAKSITLTGAGSGHQIVIVDKSDCDLTNYSAVAYTINLAHPDFVICTAGLSDRRVGVTIREVVEANLLTAMNVGQAAAGYNVPCLLVASTAGIDPGHHSWYGPAKAGVINFVRAMGNGGHKIWAISPGRIDTRMRQDDWPNEDPATRLQPGQVTKVMINIMEGHYAPGANVIVRKVGYDRIDVYEEVQACLPSLLPSD